MQEKAKYKHNKKRNAGFIYQILIQELTKSILTKNKTREKLVKNTICEIFNQRSQIKKELNIFKQFENLEKFDKESLQRLIDISKIEHMKLDSFLLENEKTKAVHIINKKIGSEIYSNFVPNYKLLATLDQIFSDKLSAKSKLVLEQNFISEIETDNANFTKLPSIDNLTFKTFVEKFNDKYNELLTEQKSLLLNYIYSLEQNNTEFKFYLNEEIGRMRKIIMEASTNEGNEEILSNKDKIIQILDEFKTVEISQEMLTNMLKIQELVHTLCRSK